MGFLDKVKNALGSRKEDAESQNNDENIVYDEIIDKSESIENNDENSNENEEIQSNDLEETPLNEGTIDELTPTEKIRNFKYLDNLIHSGVKEIVLDSDIVLDCDEESQYLEGIKLDVDDLTIDGSGHEIDAKGKTRIFSCTGKNITVKNIILKKGFTEDSGGAIRNKGKLTITETTLTENTAGHGGAIFNDSELTITKSKLQENVAYNGGAISNIGGKSSIEESIFSTNTSKATMGGCAAIHNLESDCKICKCEFLNNKSSDAILYNQFSSFYDENFKGNSFSLQIYSSYFKDNRSRYIISNDSGESNLIIFKGEFANNDIIECFIFNSGKSCRVEGVNFSNSHCNDFIKIIINETDLTWVSPKVNNDNFVFNEGHLILKESSHEVLGNISGSGSIETENSVDGEKFNFRYLDGLIHSGVDEIHLTSNIILDDNEQSEYGMGIDIDVDDIIIDGRGHTINGRGKARIFKCTGKNVVIKNITLLNGLGFNGGAIDNEGVLLISKSRLIYNKSSMDGAAIKNEGKLTITESILNENVSLNMYGGAINNGGELFISKSSINKNIAQHGGAIYNMGMLSIDESILSENIADRGAAIYNGDTHYLEGNVNIFNCEISNNRSLQNETIISNNYFMAIHYTIFKENNAVHIISNDEDNSNLSVFNCRFECNDSDAVVFNSGKFCYIEKSIFEKNSLDNIINQSELTLLNPKLNDESKTVFNKGCVLVKDSDPDFLSKIYGEGNVELLESIIPGKVKFDFGYLDDKIQESSENEIILDEDICFEDYEIDFYEGGIDLEIDGLIIDGRGHIIDGGGKSRIFLSTGRNIILKNIIFKNGYIYKNPNNILNNNGGAIKIYESSSLTIENCQFINNMSQVNAGAIQNDGVLNIIKSGFSENTADIGGAINNKGELKIIESRFCENSAAFKGGAISNDEGILCIKKATVNNNISHGSFPLVGHGGAINNHKGELRISGSALNNNDAGYGAAITNEDGVLNICDSVFDKNSANRKGGAIDNFRGVSDIYISAFNSNYSFFHGGAINNYYGELTIIESEFNENNSSGGGAINNDNGELTIIESEFNENSSRRGGAILLEGLTKFESENCTFKDNEPDDVYEEKD